VSSHTALRSRFVHPLPALAGRVSRTLRLVEAVLSGAIAHQFETTEARAVAIPRAVLIIGNDFVQGQTDGSVGKSSPL